MFVLGIVPARGGSKGIPGKNIAIVGGKPLIQHTLDAAHSSALLSDVIVSTDSPEIAAVASRAGGKVPFLRPAELATDDAKSIDVTLHALAVFEASSTQPVDAVMLLQPTSPLRTADDIDAAIQTFTTHQATSLISCCRADHVHPNILYRKVGPRLQRFTGGQDAASRRQDFDELYIRNGALYLVRTSHLRQTLSFICQEPLLYEMSRRNSINIDDPFDLEVARALLGSHLE